MNKFLTLLGKGVVLCLYWALVALFAWAWAWLWAWQLEYNIESWRTICMCTSVFSIGWGFQCIPIDCLYSVELNDLNKHKKAYDILKRIYFITLCFFVCVGLITFIIGFTGEPFLLFIQDITHIVGYTWGYWLLIIFLFIISFILKAFNLPIIKATSRIIFRISLLSAIALIIYIEIYEFKNLEESNPTPLIEDSILAGCILLIFLLGFLCFLLYNSMKRGILSFAKLKYILFLRAFKDDDTLLSLYDKISTTVKDIPLIKIGNPNKLESSNNNEHWLPLSNWKFFLKYYISRAKAIVTVVSSTDGLIWEIVENMKYLNKSIIYFSSLEELLEFKKKLLSFDKANLGTMISSVEMVIKNQHKENAFVIQHSKVYMGDVCQLINSVLKNDFENIENIKVINTNCIVLEKTNLQENYSITAIRNFLFRHFHILDFINGLESIHNQTIIIIFKCLAFGLCALFYIAEFLLGCMSILFPLAIWFDNDTLGLFDSTSEKIKITLFSIVVGAGLIKDVFKDVFGKD